MSNANDKECSFLSFTIFGNRYPKSLSKKIGLKAHFLHRITKYFIVIFTLSKHNFIIPTIKNQLFRYGLAPIRFKSHLQINRAMKNILF